MWNALSTFYKLQLVQDNTQTNGATDIQITRDTTWTLPNACAKTVSSGEFVPDPSIPNGRLFQITKRVIHLPPGSLNWSQEQLACILAHEMGHALGLADVYSGCPASIMNQVKGGKEDCTFGCDKTQVAEIDKNAVNLQAGNRPACSATRTSKTQNIVTGGGFEDPNPFIFSPHTCYYYYDAIDVYYCRWISIYDGTCLPETPPQYIGTIFILREIRCY